MSAVATASGAEAAPEVLARARSGDTHAFEELVRHYDPGLRALAFRLLGGRRAAMHDALQEAYVKAFRALPGFRAEAGLGTWLYRITYNCCVDQLRLEGNSPADPLDDETAETGPAGQPELTATRRADLARALGRLPLEQRAVVLLVDAEGLDYAAAAEVLGIAPGTVGSRLNRAHAALRALLSEGDD